MITDSERKADQGDDSRVYPQKGELPRAAVWMALAALGCCFEFLGRLLGLRDNPLGIWLEAAPLFTTASAGVIIIYGAFQIMQGWSAKDLRRFRQALLVTLLGAVMLVASMACKSIVRQVFGA